MRDAPEHIRCVVLVATEQKERNSGILAIEEGSGITRQCGSSSDIVSGSHTELLENNEQQNGTRHCTVH